MSPTIKDVAKKAGVSIATVSLVIQNHARITTATKTKVQKAIKELNYHPSRSAKGLVTKTTGNIGFILTDDHFLQTEPFYTKIFLGTEFGTRGTNYYVLLATIARDFNSKDELPRFILERSVDGIIIAGKATPDFIERIELLDIPIVFIDYYPTSGNFFTVLIDNINGGIIATKHLVDLGHKEIGFIGGDLPHPSIYDRFAGYKQALEAGGIKFNKKNCVIDEDDPSRPNGYNAARKLFAQNKKITAIFACNDAMAIGAMQYCTDNKIKIPNDVSLIGFDDVEADIFLNPPLTTIKVPKFELGTEAIHLIENVIKNKSYHNKKKILVPVELIIRNSTKELK